MYLRAIVDKAGESDGEFHFSDVEVEMGTEKSAALALGGLPADQLECFQRLPDEGSTAAQRGWGDSGNNRDGEGNKAHKMQVFWVWQPHFNSGLLGTDFPHFFMEPKNWRVRSILFFQCTCFLHSNIQHSNIKSTDFRIRRSYNQWHTVIYLVVFLTFSFVHQITVLLIIDGTVCVLFPSNWLIVTACFPEHTCIFC